MRELEVAVQGHAHCVALGWHKQTLDALFVAKVKSAIEEHNEAPDTDDESDATTVSLPGRASSILQDMATQTEPAMCTGTGPEEAAEAHDKKAMKAMKAMKATKPQRRRTNAVRQAPKRLRISMFTCRSFAHFSNQ